MNVFDHPQFAKAIDTMRDDLTKTVMAATTDEEKRKEALLKYRLIDRLVAELAQAAQ